MDIGIISNFINEIKNIKTFTNRTIIEIYIGSFNKYYGSCNLDTNRFESIKRKLLHISKFNKKDSLIYSYNNKKLIIKMLIE